MSKSSEMKKIKSVITTKHLIDENDNILESYKGKLEELNEDGKLIKSVDYGKNGDVQDWSEFEFDEKGNLILEAHYSDAETLINRFEFSYFDDSTAKEVIQTFGDGSVLTKTIHREGNSYTATTIDEDGEIDSKEVTVRNDQNQIVEEVVFNWENIVEKRFEYKYDDNGNKTEETEYGYNDDFMRRVEYLLNDSGKCIRQNVYTEKGNLTWAMNIEYTDFGEEKRLETSDGIVVNLEYDEKNNLIRQEQKNKADDTIVYFVESEYDNNGFVTSTTVYDMRSESGGFNPNPMLNLEWNYVKLTMENEFHEE